MKKFIIIGSILLGVVAKGELSTDIKQNQFILDNIKAENIELRGEIKRLSQILDKLEINLVKETKFENLGISIKRDMESFTLNIEEEDLSQGRFNRILDEFIEVIKYDPKGPVIFFGSNDNVEFLKDYFITHGIESNRISLEAGNNKEIDSSLGEFKIVETKIILKK